MRSRVGVYSLVCLLLLGSALGTGWRYQARRAAERQPGETVWRLDYAIECSAKREGVELRVAVPTDSAHCRVIRQEVRQGNLRFNPQERISLAAREMVALSVRKGFCETAMQFDLRLAPHRERVEDAGPVELTAAERESYLRATPDIRPAAAAVRDTLARLQAGGSPPDDLPQIVYAYCRDTLAVVDEGADDAATVLHDGSGSAVGCVCAFVALCRAAGIPARVVAGLDLAENAPDATPIWAEVFARGHWLPYAPLQGYAIELPYSWIALRRDALQIANAPQMVNLEFEYSLVRLPLAVLGRSVTGRHFADVFDLTLLPLDVQTVLSLVLLVPVGALVTCVFRNLIGLRTSGTFTPTLLALSFVFTDWRSGLIVLAMAVLPGIAIRYPIEHLRLLMLPRLSIVLTCVVLSIVFSVSALWNYHIDTGGQTVLLPMVILTMLVERFYVTTQEDSSREAIQRGAGTAVVGLICYLVLSWKSLAELLLIYPELHGCTIALLLVIGRYTGYQLLEGWRFRDRGAM